MSGNERARQGRSWNRRIEEMPRVGSRVTDEIVANRKAEGKGIIPVTAYPREPLPAAIMDEVVRACRAGGHAPARGLFELRAGLAAALKAETGVPLDPDREILVTQGAMHALHLVMAAVLEPGDEVVTFSPCYFFHGLVELCGARLAQVRLDEARGFAFDLDRLEAALTPRTKAILLNTPANPTGYVATRADIAAAADLAERRGLLLIADESYDRLVYDGREHFSALHAFPGAQQVVLVRAFTKSFGMPDWRVGYLCAAAPIIAQAVKIFEWEMLFGNYLGQKAAAIVLASGAPWLAGMRDEFQRNRDRLLQALEPLPRFRAGRPQGNPFLFINVASFGVPDAAAGRLLLERYGLPNTPGCAHGEPGYLRVAFGGSEATIAQAADALAQLHGALGQGKTEESVSEMGRG